MTATTNIDEETQEETPAVPEKEKPQAEPGVCRTCGRIGGYKNNPTDENCARCENKKNK